MTARTTNGLTKKLRIANATTIQGNRLERDTFSRGRWEAVQWGVGSSSSGTIYSTSTDLSEIPLADRWDQFRFVDDETEGDIVYDIQSWNGVAWVNTHLTNLDVSPVSLNLLDPSTQAQLRGQSDADPFQWKSCT